MTRGHPWTRALRALRKSAAARFAVLRIGRTGTLSFTRKLLLPLSYRGTTLHTQAPNELSPRMNWYWEFDSNEQPPAYQAGTLPG